MARPPKRPEDRKAYHLRVPLAADQRALIEDAAKLAGEDKAAWARAVLLEAARKGIGNRKSAEADTGQGIGSHGPPPVTL
jgi:uncharacterized protein (DUF1778 family)